MTSEKQPRPNSDLALRYWSDPTLKVWFWYEGNWWAAGKAPNFTPDHPWHVGHERPTEPPVKMCELAGIKFPMPMREAPKSGAAYWFVTPTGVELDNWIDHPFDRNRLTAGICQATEAGAIAQANAMQAALQQATEGAK